MFRTLTRRDIIRCKKTKVPFMFWMVNDDQRVTFESKVSASLITSTTGVGGDDRYRSQAESSANPSGPENKKMIHRTQLSSVTSGFSCNTPAEQGVLQQQLNLGPWSFDCA